MTPLPTALVKEADVPPWRAARHGGYYGALTGRYRT
jgi:hypothetical protein